MKFQIIRKNNYRDRIKSAKKFNPPIDIKTGQVILTHF